jgi:hypothetical protein
LRVLIDITPLKGLFRHSPIAGVISFGTSTSSGESLPDAFPWHRSKTLVVHSRKLEIV